MRLPRSRYKPGVLVRCSDDGPTANASLPPKENTFVGLSLSKTSDLEVLVDRSAIPGEKTTAGQPYVLRVFVDHSVIAVFTASGKALTARVYPSRGALGLWLVGGGAATSFNVTGWAMGAPSLLTGLDMPAIL